MTPKIFVLGSGEAYYDLDIRLLGDYDAMILASWASPDFVRRLERRGAKTCFSLNLLIDGYADLVRRQYTLAQQYMKVVPFYRDVNPLLGWEGSIANALMTPLAAFWLHRALLRRFGAEAEVIFQSPGAFQQAFVQVNRYAGNPLRIRIEGSATEKKGQWRRRLMGFWELCREAQADGDLAKPLWTAFQVLDGRYHVRERLWPTADVAPGGVWCYSSYVNYTRILARHADRMETQPRWVLNRYSARQALPLGSDWYQLWQFHPVHHDVEAHRNVLRGAEAALEKAPVEVAGLPLRTMLSESEVVQNLLSRALPQFLAEIDLMAAFLDQAQPEQIWAANQWGSESSLIQLAGQRGIPITQVQHGMLEQYYACAPIYSDRFLVWGEFWKEAINPAAQAQVEVVNPGFEVVPVERQEHRGPARITFFTAPLHLGTLWNVSVALWEVITLLEHLMEAGHPITIRVHPADRIDTWRSAWIEQIGALPESVGFDKGGSLESVLQETDMAIMFHSTVFLNCIASGISVISLGWYPFMWRERLEEEGLIHFVDSLEEADALVKLIVHNEASEIDATQMLAGQRS